MVLRFKIYELKLAKRQLISSLEVVSVQKHYISQRIPDTYEEYRIFGMYVTFILDVRHPV